MTEAILQITNTALMIVLTFTQVLNTEPSLATFVLSLTIVVDKPGSCWRIKDVVAKDAVDSLLAAVDPSIGVTHSNSCHKESKT